MLWFKVANKFYFCQLYLYAYTFMRTKQPQTADVSASHSLFCAFVAKSIPIRQELIWWTH